MSNEYALSKEKKKIYTIEINNVNVHLLGTVGVNIAKMLDLFKTGHEYLVERDNYIVTEVGKVWSLKMLYVDCYVKIEARI